MFQQSRGKASKNAVPVKGLGSVTIISEGCEFSGRLFCRGASRIGGKIEGTVISEGSLIIEETADVKADIESEEIIVRGRVSGDLKAQKRVELFEKAEFTGEMTTPVLVMHEGAALNGKTNMRVHHSETSPSHSDSLNGHDKRKSETGSDLNLMI